MRGSNSEKLFPSREEETIVASEENSLTTEYPEGLRLHQI